MMVEPTIWQMMVMGLLSCNSCAAAAEVGVKLPLEYEGIFVL